VKTKKLTLLIALIALMGTFTSAIPQQVFADTPGPTTATSDFCVTPSRPAANPQNLDDHDLEVIIAGNPTPFQVQLIGMYSTTGPDTPLTSLVRFFINDNAGTEATPALGTEIGQRPATIDLGVDPKDFTGTFTTTVFGLLDEGNYVGFGCGEETENSFTPVPVVGIHHSDTATFRIDRTDPTISCQNLFFNGLETDGQTILKTDSRFDAFFGVDVVVNDNLDDNLDVTDNAPTSIPVGISVPVLFTVRDDGDIPTLNDDNTATAECTIFIDPFEKEGCEGVILDQSGKPLEIEVCLEIPVREAVCGLAILGDPPTLDYGILDQDDTSETQLLQVRNDGNAPALLKVIAGDEFDLVTTPGFWIKPDQVVPEPPATTVPPFTKQMEAFRTHFSIVDRGITDAVAFYDDTAQSFPVSDSAKTIIFPILDPNVISNIFWQLRIILLDPLFFGDLQQTLTLELQECSVANECELLGQPCPSTGTTFIPRG